MRSCTCMYTYYGLQYRDLPDSQTTQSVLQKKVTMLVSMYKERVLLFGASLDCCLAISVA